MAGAGRLLGLILLFGVAAATLLTAPASAADQPETRFVRIGTGPIGGTYFPLGGLIANIISGPPGSMACELGGSCGVPGLIATAISTQGSGANVRNIATGAVELTLCQADVAHDAFVGAGPWSGKPVQNLRAVANLFAEAIHIVVRQDAGISGIRDLRGKRVSVGEQDSGTLATTRTVLRGFGMDIRDLQPVYEKLARAIEMLSQDEIDAFFMVGGFPIGGIVHIAERVPLALLPIDGQEAERIVKAEPFFRTTDIPADIYRNVAATPTIGVSAQLLAAAAMPDEVVHGITRALWDPRNRKVLETGIPIGRQLRLGNALDGLAVPLHPGARQFYAEAGLPVPTTGGAAATKDDTAPPARPERGAGSDAQGTASGTFSAAPPPARGKP